MGEFRSGKLTAHYSMTLARELAFAADRSLWSGNQIECIAAINRIYALLDAAEMGYDPDRHIDLETEHLPESVVNILM